MQRLNGQYIFVALGAKLIARPSFDGGERICPIQLTFDELIEFALQDKLTEVHISLKLLRALLIKKEMMKLKKIFGFVNN